MASKIDLLFDQHQNLWAPDEPSAGRGRGGVRRPLVGSQVWQCGRVAASGGRAKRILVRAYGSVKSACTHDLYVNRIGRSIDGRATAGEVSIAFACAAAPGSPDPKSMREEKDVGSVASCPAQIDYFSRSSEQTRQTLEITTPILVAFVILQKPARKSLLKTSN